jgi:tetratricopeptide (TPR) repeat protein
MDPSTRHQLKQNELAEALGRLRHLDSPAARYGLAALVVLLLLVLGWKGWRYMQQRALEQHWQRLSDIGAILDKPDSPDQAGAADKPKALEDLRALIRETSDPALGGYARIRLARARCDAGINDTTQQPAAIEEAVDVLRQVTGNQNTPPLVAAEAWFALANTYESLRQFDQAAQAYKTLTSNEKLYAGSPYVMLAATRLATLDKLRTPVAFEQGEPPPPPSQAAMPQPGVFQGAAGEPQTPPAESEPEVVPPEQPSE